MSIYMPPANDRSLKDFRAQATVEAAYHIGEKTLMAAFTGHNHQELARQFGLAIADVYCIIRAHQYRQLARAIAEAPLPGADSSVEVLWECHAETLANPLQTEGLLRAVRMAIEQADPDRPLDLQVVLVARRSPEPQAAQPNTPVPAEAAPAETPPGTPSRGDSPAAP